MLGSMAGATLLLGGGLVWMHVQTRAAIERLDDRISHLLAGLSLLTDTTEGALRDVATEVARLAAAKEEPRPRPRTTQRRVTVAARRGRSVQEIAAAEEVSEGEVSLRLQLERAARERANHASMR
jgi:hypothetical protein